MMAIAQQPGALCSCSRELEADAGAQKKMQARRAQCAHARAAAIATFPFRLRRAEKHVGGVGAREAASRKPDGRGDGHMQTSSDGWVDGGWASERTKHDLPHDLRKYVVGRCRSCAADSTSTCARASASLTGALGERAGIVRGAMAQVVPSAIFETQPERARRRTNPAE